MKTTREIVFETQVEGCPVNVYTIHGSGVYQAEWLFRGKWVIGYGRTSVAVALTDARGDIAWSVIATGDAS